MADMEGQIVQNDPSAPNPHDIQLPQVDLPHGQDAQPADTMPDGSLHVTIHPEAQYQQDANDQRELQTELQQEVAARAAQHQTQPDVWGQVGNAVSQGAQRDDVAGHIAETQGISQDEADYKLITTMQAKVAQARAAGWSDPQIKSYMQKSNYDPAIVQSAMQNQPLPQAAQKLDYNPQAAQMQQAQELSDLYKNVYGKYSTLGNSVLGLVSEDAGVQARLDVNQLNQGIVKKLNENNIPAYIQPNTGEVVVKGKDGVEQEVDSSMLSSLWDAKGETVGAIGGAIVGARTGATVGAALGSEVPIVGNAAGAVIGGTVGAIGGGMYGAATGKAYDLTINSMKLRDQLSTALYLQQMKQAGIADAVFGVLGTAVFKTGVRGTRAIMRAYKYVTAGNSKGAYRALLENLNITKDQAEALVKRYEEFNQTPNSQQFASMPEALQKSDRQAAAWNSLTPEQKAIQAITSTTQGAEGPVKLAASHSPRLANSVAVSIDARAKSLHAALASVTDENVGSLVRNDIGAYEADVKKFYGMVKAAGAQAVDGTDFRFNLEKLAIEPVMRNIEKQIGNPMMRERFLTYATRIANASADRTFSGLVELRQAVNDFKYSKMLSVKDLEAVNGVLNRIDGMIQKAAKDYMGRDAKAWMENFRLAKQEYAQMKQLEDNALYKIVTSPRITEDGIRKGLSKYGNSKDVDADTFNAVVTRLSPGTRAKVEVAAIKNLADKFTAGKATDNQAVHFPALAKAVQELNIVTPEARTVANAINDIAKVYRNDQVLASISGHMSMPHMHASMSADLLEKAHYAIIGQVWGAITKFIPGQGARNSALIHQVAKLLENPLHARTAEELIRNMPTPSSQAAMKSLVHDLQVQTAKAGLRTPPKTGFMYKQSANGKMSVTNGALGKGVYVFDRVFPKDAEAKVVRQKVDFSRMASLDQISAVVGRDISEKEIRAIPDLQEKLIDQGYLGIRLDDGRGMLFPDTTLGVKTPTTAPAAAAQPVAKTAAETLPEMEDPATGKMLYEVFQAGGPDKGKWSILNNVTRYTQGRFDTAEEARAFAKQNYGENFEILPAVKEIVRKVNSKEIDGQTAMAEAAKLGYNLHKVGMSKSTGLGGRWIYKHQSNR